eukprot:scaffold7435_cov65-Phaeocystis_antarctica.AAC.1
MAHGHGHGMTHVRGEAAPCSSTLASRSAWRCETLGTTSSNQNLISTPTGSAGSSSDGCRSGVGRAASTSCSSCVSSGSAVRSNGCSWLAGMRPRAPVGR